MVAEALNLVSRFIRPSWLTGPIFEKELRVSSRRKRNYVLRFVYLGLLTLFVVLVWLQATESRGFGSAAYRISRMSLAGMAIIAVITWFQFCAMQLIAVIMLSNSISDEIQHRTLATLMTTPINSFQIVMGKLFSKLWQMLILLAISIPLLAIVRVFGGVPWEYVTAGLCITLTAAIFAASVSMWLSVRNRRAYAVILKTLFVGGVLFAFLPWLLIMLLKDSFTETELIPIFVHLNPFFALAFSTQLLMSPGALRGLPSFSWPLHCAIMLGASGLILGMTVRIVRKVALRQATGEAGVFVRRRRRPAAGGEHAELSSNASARKIRRINGSPIIWKELRTPLLRGGKVAAVIGIVAAVAALLITYGVCADDRCLDENFTHAIYVCIFLGLGIICTTVLSATAITSEKEARSWPLLLATTLSDWHILAGKAFGIFKRCLPIWLLLAGHVIFFTLIGYIHPIAAVHLAMLVAWIVVFFTGTGLYFSSRFKKTTTAVVMNMGLALMIWAILPGVFAMIVEVGNMDDDAVELFICGNPIVQGVVVMEAAGGVGRASRSLDALDYDWPDNIYDGAGPTTFRMLRYMVVYVLIGALFAVRAKVRFRRNVF